MRCFFPTTALESLFINAYGARLHALLEVIELVPSPIRKECPDARRDQLMPRDAA
jgi:hypothetical protein